MGRGMDRRKEEQRKYEDEDQDTIGWKVGYGVVAIRVREGREEEGGNRDGGAQGRWVRML